MAEFKIPIEVSEASLRRIAETVVAEMRKDPNADWVEVVRCKDCKHWERDVIFSDGWCRGKRQGNPDWFCADGER